MGFVPLCLHRHTDIETTSEQLATDRRNSEGKPVSATAWGPLPTSVHGRSGLDVCRLSHRSIGKNHGSGLPAAALSCYL